MAFLGEPLKEQPATAVLKTPRCTKDGIEEELFEQRRDLFSAIDLVFFDTTSIYFEGQGGEELGQYGKSKDHRPDLKQMVVGLALDLHGCHYAASCGRAIPPMSSLCCRWSIGCGRSSGCGGFRLWRTEE